jgi:hypothetical protein
LRSAARRRRPIDEVRDVPRSRRFEAAARYFFFATLRFVVFFAVVFFAADFVLVAFFTMLPS